MIGMSTGGEGEENCEKSLDNNAPCTLCTIKLSTLLSYLTGPTVDNVSDYRAYTRLPSPISTTPPAPAPPSASSASIFPFTPPVSVEPFSYLSFPFFASSLFFSSLPFGLT
ncbi:hypothetical protein Fmac_005098 [Flemingia macrophylla]|uniref:Uncharacterized protein n=1 Tax=Flemingia macrophylla TaxID=520843 RepID=A0ABD1N6S9_9FABA